jgi:hypothetical protein
MYCKFSYLGWAEVDGYFLINITVKVSTLSPLFLNAINPEVS